MLPKSFSKSLQNFENKDIESFSLKPHEWKRFVDDTNLIWTHGRENLNKFLTHLNNQSEHIQFTMEVQENNCLPFLDVLITKNEDGSLAHQVYRKKMHTDTCLHATSHHHPSQKLGILNTLSIRAIRIFEKEHLDEEHLAKFLQENGYKLGDINRTFKKEKNLLTKDCNKTKQIENIKRVVLPYIQGTTDKIARILRKKHIETDFSPPNFLRNMLDKENDPVDPMLKKGVYSIPCLCDEEYIKET